MILPILSSLVASFSMMSASLTAFYVDNMELMLSSNKKVWFGCNLKKRVLPAGFESNDRKKIKKKKIIIIIIIINDVKEFIGSFCVFLSSSSENCQNNNRGLLTRINYKDCNTQRHILSLEWILVFIYHNPPWQRNINIGKL